MGPKEEQNTFIFIIEYRIKIIPMTNCYNHSFGTLSTIIEETSSFRRRKSTQRSGMDQGSMNNTLWNRHQ